MLSVVYIQFLLLFTTENVFHFALTPGPVLTVTLLVIVKGVVSWTITVLSSCLSLFYRSLLMSAVCRLETKILYLYNIFCSSYFSVNAFYCPFNRKASVTQGEVMNRTVESLFVRTKHTLCLSHIY